MSGGNCPETPRQKMIGMMYLFLTAMLALNVSGELLTAFVTMDKGFVQTRETAERKNEVLYREFHAAKTYNPGKAGEAWKDANRVKNAADALVAHIQELKIIMAHMSSGAEATPDNYLGIDNQDIAPQLMITEKQGERSELLKDSINAYKDLLLSFLDVDNGSDTTFINAYESIFDTKDVKGEKDVKKTWESTKFEHVPLSASMAYLSKIQGDVRNAESDMVGALYAGIDKDSYKFTDMNAVVRAAKTTILEGEMFEAELFMAAYDPTITPKIEINGKQILDIVDGKGILNLSGNVGEHKWSGHITMPSPDGSEFIPYPVEGQYTVVKPNAVISPTKMNVFYEGVDNPVEISVPGVASNDLDIRMSNVSKRKKGSGWIVKPNSGSAGKKSVVSVYAQIGDAKKFIGKQEFRIKRVPSPIPVVAGKEESGKISKNILIAQKAVFAKMKDFDFELEYNVTKFTVSVLKGGYIQDETSNSNRFTKAQKDLIGSMSRNQKVSIEDIRAKGPDGRTRKLGTMTFVLD